MKIKTDYNTPHGLSLDLSIVCKDMLRLNMGGNYINLTPESALKLAKWILDNVESKVVFK